MARLASTLAAAALVALGASGCVGDLTQDHVDSIRGQLGAVAFSGAPEIREVTIDSTELRVDLRLHDEGWAVMVGIRIPRDTTAEHAGSSAISLQPQNARMVGCSGGSDGSWDFDCEPRDLDVGVSPLGEVRFNAVFTSDTCRSIPPEDPPERVSGEVDLI